MGNSCGFNGVCIVLYLENVSVSYMRGMDNFIYCDETHILRTRKLNCSPAIALIPRVLNPESCRLDILAIPLRDHPDVGVG